MKAKTYPKLIILVFMLTIAVVAGIPGISAASSKPTVAWGFPSTSTEMKNLAIAGEPSSGWINDRQAAGQDEDEVNPSMGTYIDSGTGDVILFVAAQRWDPTNSRWILHVYRSNNRGASWYHYFWALWSNPATRSILYPSIAVSPYNGTVLIAVQDSAVGALSNDISVWRINIDDSSISHHNIDADGNDDRSPQLVSEYAWGAGSYFYVSYEYYHNYDDRDLKFGVSIDWGQTWTTSTLRGTMLDPDWSHVFTQSAITYAQNNIYIAYRHSANYSSIGQIDVAYSTNYGSTWNFVADVSGVDKDASWPSIAGSRIGPSHAPTTLMVAYEYAYTAANHDILITWSEDAGATWTGGNDTYHRIAASAVSERKPKLAVDGMGTESMSVGGNFHLVYRTTDMYYTQLPFWDIPRYRGGPYAYYGYDFGWSSPHGVVNDDAAAISSVYPHPTIVTYTRTVGGQELWEPGVAWSDFRNPSYDVYYTTPGTHFSITFIPKSQKVVVGKSLSYYVTVNRLAGFAATAYLARSLHLDPVHYGTAWYQASFSPPTVVATGTSTLTITISNLLPVGSYSLNISATIGGYRRIVAVPFTVISGPSLTLNLNPFQVARGALLTISGQLTPAPGSPQKIYLYYRNPHLTGPWKLATTLTTNAAGAYIVGVTVPMTLPVGTYDLVAFWVDTSNGDYATSPIKVLIIM